MRLQHLDVESALGAAVQCLGQWWGHTREAVTMSASQAPVQLGRRRITTRAGLEHVAFELFDTHGFEGPTVDDIATAAGIGRRTFFRYFPSKNDVPCGSFEAELDRMRAWLAACPAQTALMDAIRLAIVDLNTVPRRTRCGTAAGCGSSWASRSCRPTPRCATPRRDWGSPWIPEHLDLQAMVRTCRRSRSGRATWPAGSGPARCPTSACPTWAPAARRCPARPDDARRAVDAGASAISVSNHGGNNLDSTPASIRCLPGIADAVGGQIEVLLDGGVRRGSDVVKALALGAQAVMIGRACLWGMAAGGQQGVSNVLEILRQGISETLYGLGKASVHDVTRDDVIVPEGFTLDQKL